MFWHIHGITARMLTPASIVPVQARNYLEAVTVLPIPVRKQDVTVKFREPTTDALHINHSIMQAWASQLPHIRSRPVMILDVLQQELPAALTAAGIPVQRVPALERH